MRAQGLMLAASFLVGASLLAGAGCASLDPEDAASPEGRERFEGTWFIEETEAHALYGAARVDLQGDGAIEVVWESGLYPLAYPAISSPDGAVHCGIGDSWDSYGDDVLMLSLSCDDDVDRLLELRFTSPAASNASGAVVEIDAVDGEAGWNPPAWGWTFQKL